MNPIDDFTDTSRIMSGLLERLNPADLDTATPCARWSVADLVDHIVGDVFVFVGAAGADASAPVGPVTADNAVSRYASATAAVLAAYQANDTLNRDLATPFGTFPGSMVLSVAFADQLTHCWDLARSIEAPVVASDELVDNALNTWTAFIQSDYRDGEMFGDAQTCGPDASNLDRLAAFTGRNV